MSVEYGKPLAGLCKVGLLGATSPRSTMLLHEAQEIRLNEIERRILAIEAEAAERRRVSDGRYRAYAARRAT